MTTRQYQNWICSLKKRYRSTQIKASVAVNSAMLEFYWSLGADISRMYPGKKRNLNFFENLSNDLCLGIDNPKGLSTRNLKYALAFYQLFSYRQQVVADKVGDNCLPKIVKKKTGDSYLQQVVEGKEVVDRGTYNSDRYLPEIVKVQWGHHTVILGKCKGNQEKVFFYVRKTIENGWSRTDLQVAIGEGLYEKTGKALTNFAETLPAPDGYLAKELIKNDPNLTNKKFYYLLTMADTNRAKFDGSLAALRGFLDCCEGSEECGMVCADGVYEKGTVNGTKFVAEAKALGKGIR